jgi:hypothetical protein
MPGRSLTRRVVRRVREYFRSRSLSAAAKEARDRDAAGVPTVDPGSERVIDAGLDWLCAAQDRSASHDGGVARDYSLIKGWSTSYPETTGYIVPTFLAHARGADAKGLRARARRMLDWLVGIQLPSGAFQGGKIDSQPATPVTFNTGQVLLGLTDGEVTFGAYGDAARRAADWLVRTQDADGCWRNYPTPFAAPGEKTYETHVAWGLLEAARLFPNRGYGEAGLANVHWALAKQRDNGWLDDCCLHDGTKPLTHTLGYALRGLLEGYRFGREPHVLAAAQRTADALLRALQPNGFLAGRFCADWSPAATWACLTGTTQIAHCWLMLFAETRNERYRHGADLANAYVRRTVYVDGPEETRGGLKGSFPIDGDYGRFQYLNWGPKFLIDSLVLQAELAHAAAGEAGSGVAQGADVNRSGIAPSSSRVCRR